MKTRRLAFAVSLLVGALSQFSHAASPDTAADIGPQRIYYFGNSFLENSVPWFHPTLAKSAGEDLTIATSLGPGWQIWMHVNQLNSPSGPGPGIRKNLVEGDWNGIVIQYFGRPGLVNVTGEMFGKVKFDPPKDVGDIASAGELIELFQSRRGDRGRAFIYSSWPEVTNADAYRKRVRDEAAKSLEAAGESREETLRKVKEIKPNLAQIEEMARGFDYSKPWLEPYTVPDGNLMKMTGRHSRDYADRLMAALKERFPKMWAERRLSLIPNGEVFYQLDKKFRAGAAPGIENVGFFTRDGGHVRAGLPRYTLAATVFAVVFGRHPEALDWSIYNDLENYKTEKLPVRGYVHQPDLGPLLEITPERAKLVNDTVWEVVSTHPDVWPK